MKRFFACALFLVLSAGSAVAGDVIVTPNTAWGQPDRFQKATVIEEQYDGSRVAREETLPGSRIGNRFERGTVIEDNGDGSYTGRRESFPGSGIPDRFDSGFTIEQD